MPENDFRLIARQLGLPVEIIEHCFEVGLVQPQLSDHDLAELRRVRRLQEHLEVNLAGVEVILRMRRRMRTMQREVDGMRREMAQLEAQFEQEFQRLQRRLASDR